MPTCRCRIRAWPSAPLCCCRWPISPATWTYRVGAGCATCWSAWTPAVAGDFRPSVVPVRRPAARQRERFGNGVVATRAQRLAAQQAPQRQHAAAPRAEARHGDARVIGARRLEAALPAQKRAKQPFVAVQEKQDEAGHGLARKASANVNTRDCKRGLPVSQLQAITAGRRSTTPRASWSRRTTTAVR